MGRLEILLAVLVFWADVSPTISEQPCGYEATEDTTVTITRNHSLPVKTTLWYESKKPPVRVELKLGEKEFPVRQNEDSFRYFTNVHLTLADGGKYKFTSEFDEDRDCVITIYSKFFVSNQVKEHL